MDIKNPLFQIPDGNNKKEHKSGGGNPPDYRGDPNDFEGHKRQRVGEVDFVLDLAKASKSPVAAPHDKIFYEVEFHEQALSKSAQPRKLLETNNLDVYAQISDRNFLVASTIQNLKSFRDSVSRFDLVRNKNESAYLSAITKISVINQSEKLAILDFTKEQFNAYLFLADVLSESEAREITNHIIKQGISDAEYFVSNSGAKIIYGHFDRSFIDAISGPDPKNPVVRVEEVVNFFAPQALPLEYDHEHVGIGDVVLDAKVGVVDSGIFDHPLLNGLVVGTENHINDVSQEDRSHGTFVAGRVIFGNDIERQIRSQNYLTPLVKVVDIHVMKKGVGASDREILDALRDVVSNTKYQDVRVFNLSLNSDQPIRNADRCFFTRDLDSIAHQYKVCIVVTAGNHKQFVTNSYPECLYLPEAAITAPADLVNGISVGSIADTDSSRSLARNNEPSPFTRLGLQDTKKPDLVHFGGNIDQYGSPAGIGVRSIGADSNKIYENIGTSFAAPLVSGVVAQIIAYLKSINKVSIDLAKALLLHSADYNLPHNSQIDSQDLPRIVGFGIPDFSRALSCAQSMATFVYTGVIQASKYQQGVVKQYKHKIRFVVPSELSGKGRKIKVKGTLVYTPLISKSGQVDYTQADIEINLHYKNSSGTDTSAGLKSESIDNRIKWNPVKSFEKSFSNYQGGDWEVWLTLTTRGDAEVVDYSQEYALVITVEDVTPDISKRIPLYQIIKEQYPVYVPINHRVGTKIKV
jgi:hypothetical protein